MELILGSGVSATKDTLNGITLTGITPLWYALESHNVAITRMMLKKGASANDKNSAGLTPLKFAVEADDFALAQKQMNMVRHLMVWLLTTGILHLQESCGRKFKRGRIIVGTRSNKKKYVYVGKRRFYLRP